MSASTPNLALGFIKASTLPRPSQLSNDSQASKIRKQEASQWARVMLETAGLKLDDDSDHVFNLEQDSTEAPVLSYSRDASSVKPSPAKPSDSPWKPRSILSKMGQEDSAIEASGAKTVPSTKDSSCDSPRNKASAIVATKTKTASSPKFDGPKASPSSIFSSPVPDQDDPHPPWMKMRLNTPSRPGRFLPTVLEVSEGAIDLVDSDDEGPINGVRSLLFPRSPIPPSHSPPHSPTSVTSFTTNTDSIPSCTSCALPLTASHQILTLKPCGDMICKSCFNTLLNSTCNSPPSVDHEGFIKCGKCGTGVSGFDRSPVISAVADANIAHVQEVGSPWLTPVKPRWALGRDGEIPTELSPPRSLKWSASPSSASGGSMWSTPSLSSVVYSSGGSSCGSKLSPSSKYTEIVGRNSEGMKEWPLVRIDNISWTLNTSAIHEWLPSPTPLPAPHLNPSPVHILCTPKDGKTLNFAFIECKNLASAQRLVRERNGRGIKGRGCSVVLARREELRNAVFDNAQSPDQVAEQLLKLCSLLRPHVVKAPERPFLHLASLAGLILRDTVGKGKKAVVEMLRRRLGACKEKGWFRERGKRDERCMPLYSRYSRHSKNRFLACPSSVSVLDSVDTTTVNGEKETDIIPLKPVISAPRAVERSGQFKGPEFTRLRAAKEQAAKKK